MVGSSNRDFIHFHILLNYSALRVTSLKLQEKKTHAHIFSFSHANNFSFICQKCSDICCSGFLSSANLNDLQTSLAAVWNGKYFFHLKGKKLDYNQEFSSRKICCCCCCCVWASQRKWAAAENKHHPHGWITEQGPRGRWTSELETDYRTKQPKHSPWDQRLLSQCNNLS